MLNKTKHRVIFVEWKDASNMPGWISPEDEMPPLVHIQSVGWLVKENKEAIWISTGVDYTRGGWTGLIAIPKGWIKKRRYVKV